jgi:NAD(P) transhydrogenase subunit beta
METLESAVYLVAIGLFILGMRDLASPKTARRGNGMAAVGMLLAFVVTLLDRQILDYTYIVAGIVIGSAIGVVAARRIQMTAMPQFVALLNGLGGAASTLVVLAEYQRTTGRMPPEVLCTLVLSLLIGTVTFTGSAVAYAKLQGLMRGSPVVFRFQQKVNALLLIASLLLGGLIAWYPAFWEVPVAIVLLSGVLGVLLVIPIGGADMPVVISLLNSYSGLAAAATGFVLANNMLIVSGALVGASGIILSQIMCKAMNRSLTNVLFGAVGGQVSVEEGTGLKERRRVTGHEAEDVAVMLETAQSVIMVPGYGLAVAQAQHALHDLEQILTERGVNVRYAIHPVAGRMPGHMNVLLAEANVSYDLLCTMEDINDDFQNTDVALVIGANDVINPAARGKKDSPLYGMPILNVDKARTAIICKRGLSPGFSGVDNELFYDPKTMMVFSDAKQTLTRLVHLLKG